MTALYLIRSKQDLLGHAGRRAVPVLTSLVRSHSEPFSRSFECCQLDGQRKNSILSEITQSLSRFLRYFLTSL